MKKKFQQLQFRLLSSPLITRYRIFWNVKFNLNISLIRSIIGQLTYWPY